MTNGAFLHPAIGRAGVGCYRLDPARIGRFYTGQTRLMDKLPILIGQPSVPLSRGSGDEP